MMHKAWNSIEEVPYCFSRSPVKFEGHTGQKIADFYPNLAFPDCNSILNRYMTMKWCTKLEVAENVCPIVFQGHPLNLEVIGDKKIPILIQIERFWTVTPVWIHHWLWNDTQSLHSKEDVSYFFFIFFCLPSNFQVKWAPKLMIWTQF